LTSSISQHFLATSRFAPPVFIQTLTRQSHVLVLEPFDIKSSAYQGRRMLVHQGAIWDGLITQERIHMAHMWAAHFGTKQDKLAGAQPKGAHC
jgi:hypothetical protein